MEEGRWEMENGRWMMEYGRGMRGELELYRRAVERFDLFFNGDRKT